MFVPAGGRSGCHGPVNVMDALRAVLPSRPCVRTVTVGNGHWTRACSCPHWIATRAGNCLIGCRPSLFGTPWLVRFPGLSGVERTCTAEANPQDETPAQALPAMWRARAR